MDDPGIPVYLLLVVFVAIPCSFALLFGWATSARFTPLVFRCRRCDREFRGSAWKGFPRGCPLCGARDWNRAR